MLELKNLTVRYDKHLALDKVSLTLSKGETVVILGANGAGKTSLLKAMAGVVRPEPGSDILMDGQRITGLRADQVTNAGVALVPEGRGIVGMMSVEDNLRLGANPVRARAVEEERLELVLDIFPKLKQRLGQYVRTMSGGEQQMVAVGRAMMSNPDYLLLDEPSLGLAPIVVGDMFRALAKIAKTGVGLLIVEQNVRVSLGAADRGFLLEAGRVTGSGTAQDLLNDEAVRHAFLGGTS